MALLVDEFGVVSGLITLENILEEIVGPIQDEFDAEQPRIRTTGATTFEIDASCPLANLRREINLKVPEVESDTVGGLVIELLGHIPRVGEFLVVGRHKITVTSAERTRVLSLRVDKVPPSETGTADKPPSPGAG
jgi:CBS domain containing-hemolysin-like protein